MKKKRNVILVIMLSLIFVYTCITVNAESSQGYCETESKYYLFMLGVNRSSDLETSDVTTYFVDEELPADAVIKDISIEATRGMSKKQFEIYVKMINSAPEEGGTQSKGDYCDFIGFGENGAPICSKEINGKIYRTNAGVRQEDYELEQNFGIIKLEEWEDEWSKNIISPTGINVTCPVENAVGNQIHCSMHREWDKNDYSQYDPYYDKTTYLVPAVARISVKYTSKTENCDNSTIPAPKKELNFNCVDGGDYEEIKNETIEASRTIYERDAGYSYYKRYQYDKGNCSTNLEQKIIGDINISQETSTFSFPGFSEEIINEGIYAGGGFAFSFDYRSEATYIMNSGLRYIITEYYPTYTCPNVPYEYEIYKDVVYKNGSLTEEDGTMYCEYDRKTEIYYTFTKDNYENYQWYYNSLCNGNEVEENFDDIEDLYYCKVRENMDEEITIESEDEECKNLTYFSKQEVNYPSGTVNEASKICTYKSEEKEIIIFKDNHYERNRDFYKGLCTGKMIRDSYDGDSDMRWCRINNGNILSHQENAIEGECDTISTEWTCENGYEGCGNNSTEMKLFAEKMAEKIENPNLKNNGEIYSIDTNTNVSAQVKGTWEENDDDLNITEWFPNETISYDVSFKLAKACIGLGDNEDTKAPLTYITTGSCDLEKTIYKGRKYYTPLKWNDADLFPVSLLVDEISIIDTMDWDANKTCNVDVYQKMYSGTQYNFIYRPIKLDRPFPGRTAGANWTSFMEDYESNDSYAKSKLTRNKLEYDINLTQEKIIEIKNYDDYAYPSLNSVYASGRSKALAVFDISGKSGNYYNSLGKCTYSKIGDKKCWTSQ